MRHGLGFHNRHSAFGFQPISLYTGGVAGAWYDPSDYGAGGTGGVGTLFQDSAGTTPVTGVEQVVGRMLDKSGNGYHATATGTARPTLSARVNLLTKTEEFDDAAWATNATITAASGIAPNGTNTASKYQGNGVATTQYVYYTTQYNNKAGELLTVSAYLKYGNRRYVQLFVGATGSDMFGCVVDLVTGTISSTGVRAGGVYSSSSIISVGDGWYQVSVTGSSTATNNGYWQLLATDNSSWTAGTPNIAANTLYTLVWGADLRVTNDGVNIPTYQRVNTATDYDTAGFPLYLSFAGAQAMSTPANIDFSGTDKMLVCAGVRKLSDAALADVVELSANAGTNSGSFFLFAPRNTATADFGYRSTGTTLQDATSAASFASPYTAVLSGVSNISAPVATLRINGSQVANNTGSQGTGNYGSYPLFIGARNLASLFFTGRVYGLIVAGSQYTAGQVSATEAYMNSKTAAYV